MFRRVRVRVTQGVRVYLPHVADKAQGGLPVEALSPQHAVAEDLGVRGRGLGCVRVSVRVRVRVKVRVG